MDAPPGSLTLSKGSGAQSAPAGWTAHHGGPDTPSLAWVSRLLLESGKAQTRCDRYTKGLPGPLALS